MSAQAPPRWQKCWVSPKMISWVCDDQIQISDGGTYQIIRIEGDDSRWPDTDFRIKRVDNKRIDSPALFFSDCERVWCA